MKDTRDRNEYPPKESIFFDYPLKLLNALESVDKENLKKVANALIFARKAHLRIFACGNGGSAAIAQHLMCDLSKGCYFRAKDPLQVISLADNMPLITAIANDISYEEIFAYQLALQNPKRREILFLISSSGNSPNIRRALEYARSQAMTTVGLSGFDGGWLRAECDLSLHVNAKNYGLVEDSHQALMHMLAQEHYLSLR